MKIVNYLPAVVIFSNNVFQIVGKHLNNSLRVQLDVWDFQIQYLT